MTARRLVAPARRATAIADPLFVDNARADGAGTDTFDPVTFEDTKTYADGIEADGFDHNTLGYQQYKTPEVPPALIRQIHDEIITALSGGDEGAQTVKQAAADTWQTVGAIVGPAPVRLLGSSDNRFSITVTATPAVPINAPTPFAAFGNITQTTVPPNTLSVPILPNDPNRISADISNFGPANLYIWTDDHNNRRYLPNNGAPVTVYGGNTIMADNGDTTNAGGLASVIKKIGTSVVPPATGVIIGNNGNLVVGNGLFIPVGTVVTLPVATELWAIAPNGNCNVSVSACYS